MIKHLSILCLAAVAMISSGIALVTAAIFDAVPWLDPRPAHFRFLDPTPRSILETRRMGLA